MPSGLKTLQERTHTPTETNISLIRDGKLTNSAENITLKSIKKTLDQEITEIKSKTDAKEIEYLSPQDNASLPLWCDANDELLPDIYSNIRMKEVNDNLDLLLL